MIIWLNSVLQVPADFPLSRLLGYVTFRALLAMAFAFLLGVFLGKRLITVIYQLNFRDKARDYGDISPKNKSGTPTMGGLIIFISFLLSVLLWAKLNNFFSQVMLMAAFWFTAIGFLDDYLKSVRGGSDLGMSRPIKLFFQVLFAVVLSLFIFSSSGPSPLPADIATKLFVPFVKNAVMDLGGFYVLFMILTVIGIANAINFADGMDGLATVPTALVAFAYGVFAYIMSNSKAASYLIYPRIPGAEELVIVLGALIGSLMAFLWYNAYPAEIFMGDTGSMMLGGLIATAAILTKHEIMFLIVGGVFVIEFLSVFIQDYIGIKLLKKRLFYRAPIHHSYQFLGIAESKIVVRFWILSIIMTVIGLISIKLR